jgi:hypothetical protein
MFATLMSTVLLATPVVPESEARGHVWVNLAPTILGLVGVPRGPAAALGASFAMTPALWVTLETTFFGFPSEYLCATKGTVFWNAVGVSIRPFEKVRGAFLLPKLAVRVATTEGLSDSERVDESVCIRLRPYPNGTEWDLGGGLSVGFDFTLWKHLYVGIAAGGGAAACFNCTTPTGPEARMTRLRLTVDLSLRLGATF